MLSGKKTGITDNKCSYLDSKGEILYLSGDYAGAYAVWQEIHAKDPDYPRHDWAKKVEEIITSGENANEQ